jgi:uncharacterized protein (DUF305 family)
MIKYILIILLIIIIYNSNCEKTEPFKTICNSQLNDIEFLEHMIEHHQVAIDISKILQKKTRWVQLQKVLRELIWTQTTEITLMKVWLKSLPERISDSQMTLNREYISTYSDFIKPNKLGLTNVYCDPLFFDPKKHMKHLHHVNDKSYIDHMIPHHMVAVDMSKILLKNTNNDLMIGFAYRIIKAQQSEIIMLENLKKSLYKHHSNLI